MKYQSLFLIYGKNKKNIPNLSSAEYAKRVVKVKILTKATHNFLVEPISYIILRQTSPSSSKPFVSAHL